MDTSGILEEPIDKTKVPPLHQKRIAAFVNQFLLSTCKFLNEFVGRCEEKFIILERKIQKVESALTIIEAKLASIPDLEGDKTSGEDADTSSPAAIKLVEVSAEPAPSEVNPQPKTVTSSPPAVEEAPVATGIKACDDVRYKKFFKMVQFGVPHQAVKIKMQIEGADPEILDTPNLILPDGVDS